MKKTTRILLNNYKNNTLLIKILIFPLLLWALMISLFIKEEGEEK